MKPHTRSLKQHIQPSETTARRTATFQVLSVHRRNPLPNMSRPAPPLPTRYDDRPVTVRDFLYFIRRSRWILLASMLFFALAVFALAEVLPPEYTASVTLVPTPKQGPSSGIGSLSSAVSGLGGLASLAGINIGNTTGQKAVALATLKSHLLLNKFITKNHLMPILFPSDWNAKQGTWLSSNPKRIPHLWDADQLFDKAIRTIKTNTRSGVVVLTIKWHNPTLAAEWANGLVNLTNNYLRNQKIKETRRELAYLRRQISKTNVVAVRNAIYGLMETEIKTLMIATGRKQFAFRVVDPAIPPRRPISPRPLLWTVGGALIGLFLGGLIAVLHETLMEDPRDLVQPMARALDSEAD